MINSYEKKCITRAVSDNRRQHLEQSEFCENCMQETDIEKLNLATGLCPSCSKWDKKKMREMIEKGLRFKDV